MSLEPASAPRVAGLFAGIGGVELGLDASGHRTELLCEVWPSAQAVLRHRFPDVPLEADIRSLKTLPPVEVVTAGFPCTDLSQAGRTAGIRGAQSSLVGEVFRLLARSRPQWLVLENVRNMLPLDGGRAMRYLTAELEGLGYRWAYRVVDSRFSGVPQRRHRVLMVASTMHDPREVLFADDAGEPDESSLRGDAYGFYWTEGLRGLGWARDAVPPLKGGSTVGIPSPPGIWIPGADLGQRLVQPGIEDAEFMQGFPRGWTAPADPGRRNGPRWKLVGNAVTVGVSTWLGRRLRTPGPIAAPDAALSSGERWPDAAWGENGTARRVFVSAWPERQPYQHLMTVVDAHTARPLSHKAAAGFLNRTQRAKLRFVEDFILDVKEHVEFTRTGGTHTLFV